MKRRFQRLLPLISALLLVFSAGLLSHILKEKASLEEALQDLTTYQAKLSRQKRALATLAQLRKEMEKKGLSGEEEGVYLEASFVVVDFKGFLKNLSDIYHAQGFFFLEKFEERTSQPSQEGEEEKPPLAMVKIQGRKIVGYRP